MKQWKGFLSGILVTLLVLGMGGAAVAAVAQNQATLAYNDIKITLDGKAVTPTDANGQAVEPFAIEGTTYLPVRAVASALGLDVEWDGATKTVKLSSGANSTTPPTEPTDSATPAPAEYTRINPAPVGTPQTFTIKTTWGEYNVTMTITDTFRGQTAWAAIREANRFNAAPSDGREYILAAVKVTVNSVSEDRSISFDEFDFTPFSGTNDEYEKVSTVEPDPNFKGKAYEGGTLEGFVSFVVDTDDESPKVAYGLGYDGTGGAWFALDK